jgi:hypothetical protein
MSRECENTRQNNEQQQEMTQACENTRQNNEQQQEMSRECENKSNQPTPCHEPLQEMSRE